MAQQIEQYLIKSKALPAVELRSARHSKGCYSLHSHDEFSFGVIDQGNASYRNTGRAHQISRGCSVTINPGDVHSCNPSSGEWSYRMLFVDAKWLGALQSEVGLASGVDYRAFNQDYCSDKSTYRRFDQLYQALLIDNNALQAEELFLECVLPYFTSRVNTTPKHSPAVSLVQQKIMDQLSDNLALRELSELSQLSRYHLVRSFKAHFGQAPHAYQLDQRIKRAKQLLQRGDSLIDTAANLGFSDQSHFQRNFKKRTALTPRQYQQLITI